MPITAKFDWMTFSQLNCVPNIPFIIVPGAGWEAQGAGVAIVNLDANNRPEMMLTAYDNPIQDNTFRYKIGWNLESYGVASSWSNLNIVPGVGWEAQGAGVAVANIDSDGRPEMILMAYDNPPQANQFRYKIGWNIDSNGRTSTWTGPEFIPGVGWEAQGAEVAITNLDTNSRPEMILMAYDNPDQTANTFGYEIGWNLDSNGRTSTWTGPEYIPGVGWEAQGAGVSVTNIDSDGRPEIVLMAYDNPPQNNTFRYKIGWNLNSSGIATGWSDMVTFPGVGWEAKGSDVTIGNQIQDPRQERISNNDALATSIDDFVNIFVLNTV
jgi:hypothetical protein